MSQGDMATRKRLLYRCSGRCHPPSTQVIEVDAFISVLLVGMLQRYIHFSISASDRGIPFSIGSLTPSVFDVF